MQREPLVQLGLQRLGLGGEGNEGQGQGEKGAQGQSARRVWGRRSAWCGRAWRLGGKDKGSGGGAGVGKAFDRAACRDWVQ